MFFYLRLLSTSTLEKIWIGCLNTSLAKRTLIPNLIPNLGPSMRRGTRARTRTRLGMTSYPGLKLNQSPTRTRRCSNLDLSLSLHPSPNTTESLSG